MNDQSSQADIQTSHALNLKDIHNLDQLRDELKLQGHLLAAELKDRFQKLEGDWASLDAQIQPLRTAAGKATGDVSAAVKLLFDTVKNSYEELKAAASLKH